MDRPLVWLMAASFAGLSGCSSGNSPAEPAAAARDPDAGEQIYRGNCIACHQENGAGLAGVYPSLAGSPMVAGDPAAFARWVVKGQRSPSMPEGRYATVMPRFGWLKPRDGAALLNFLRSHFGNAAPPVTAAAVAEGLGE